MRKLQIEMLDESWMVFGSFSGVTGWSGWRLLLPDPGRGEGRRGRSGHLAAQAFCENALEARQGERESLYCQPHYHFWVSA